MTRVTRSEGERRSSGVMMLDRPVDVHDHASWGYVSNADRAAAASRWLTGGLEAGQRAVYVADAERDELFAEIGDVPDLHAAARCGALQVLSAQAIYDLSAPIDASAQLAIYARAVDDAIAAGYRGVRVAADITGLVVDPSRRPAHLLWEQVADRYISEHPLTPLCLYDVRRVPDIDAIVAVHPLQGPTPQPFRVYAGDAHTVVLEGEIDACTSALLTDVLRALPATDTALDLRGLTFADGHATWALQDELDRRRAAGRTLSIAGANAMVRRLWTMCGFDRSLLAST